MPVTIARDIVFSSSYFLSYELVRLVQSGDYNENVKFAIAGGFAGFFSTIVRYFSFINAVSVKYHIFYHFFSLEIIIILFNFLLTLTWFYFLIFFSLPLDVLKTRIQTQAHLPVEERYSTYTQAIKDMASKEGKAVFMRGLEPRILSTIVSSSITFIVYENLKALIERQNRS